MKYGPSRLVTRCHPLSALSLNTRPLLCQAPLPAFVDSYPLTARRPTRCLRLAWFGMDRLPGRRRILARGRVGNEWSGPSCNLLRSETPKHFRGESHARRRQVEPRRALLNPGTTLAIPRRTPRRSRRGQNPHHRSRMARKPPACKPLFPELPVRAGRRACASRRRSPSHERRPPCSTRQSASR